MVRSSSTLERRRPWFSSLIGPTIARGQVLSRLPTPCMVTTRQAAKAKSATNTSSTTTFSNTHRYCINSNRSWRQSYPLRSSDGFCPPMSIAILIMPNRDTRCRWLIPHRIHINCNLLFRISFEEEILPHPRVILQDLNKKQYMRSSREHM